MATALTSGYASEPAKNCKGLFDQIGVWSGSNNCGTGKSAPTATQKPLEMSKIDIGNEVMPSIPKLNHAPLPQERPQALDGTQTSERKDVDKVPAIDNMPIGSLKSKKHDNEPAYQPSPLQNPLQKKEFKEPRQPTVHAPRYGRQTLADVVDRTIADHPLIGVQVAKLDELRQAVKAVEAGRYPQTEIRLGSGHGSAGNLKNDTTLFGQNDLTSALRADGAISLKQLVYDFDGLKNDILKNKKILTSEEFKTLDKVEEITLKVALSYLKITEQRELLAAAEKNVGSLNKLARLVNQNEKNGNATLADVKRIKARQVEAESQRTDLNADLMLAQDQFRRLAKMDAGSLQTAPLLANRIPAKKEMAILEAREQAPRLQAFHSQNSAMVNEMNSQKAVSRPKIQAETEASTKNYLGNTNAHSEADIRAMIGMRYKFMDGGQNKALEEAIKARQEQGALKLRHEEEEVEADIRQFYNALIAARSKISNLRVGLDASTKVQDLYIEQFLGGKRTLFELLDSQQQLYQARRAVIQNQFEERRSVYGVLRSMGRLSNTILNEGRMGGTQSVGSISKKPAKNTQASKDKPLKLAAKQ